MRCCETAAEAGPQDYVVITLKAHSVPGVVSALKPLLGRDTAIVWGVNGVPWWYFHRLAGPHAGRGLHSVDPGGLIGQAIEPERVIGAVVDGADAAVPGIPVTDTIKQVNAQNIVVATPDRSTLVAVQTPQAFRASVLRDAHASSPEGTDDATLVESMGMKVVVVAGESMNRKLTAPEDLEWARAMARAEA